MKNYHCDRKFDSLKIDAEQKVLHSCWKADGENIDLAWLAKNKGKLFNTPNLLKERQEMLSGQRVKSCEQTCFRKEDQSLWSPRLAYNGQKAEHKNIKAYPAFLDLTLSSECNMACVYCCREYSSSWKKDLEKNGSYKGLTAYQNRYEFLQYDKVLKKLSQKKKFHSSQYKLLLEEIKILLGSVQKLALSGGEPLLHNNLFDILEHAKDIKQININTGLGIQNIRFANVIAQLKNYKNINLRISVESTGKNYELVRQGNTWKNFENNLQTIIKNKIKYYFNTTHCNISILDYIAFNEKFPLVYKNFNVVYEPDFLSPHVLDNQTKEKVINDLKQSKYSNTKTVYDIIKLLKPTPSESQRANFENFIKEFKKRREIVIDFLPISLRKWLNLDV